MNKELKEILLDIFRREEKAAQVQESRAVMILGDGQLLRLESISTRWRNTSARNCRRMV